VDMHVWSVWDLLRQWIQEVRMPLSSPFLLSQRVVRTSPGLHSGFQKDGYVSKLNTGEAYPEQNRRKRDSHSCA
jgi:hypothetical protein